MVVHEPGAGDKTDPAAIITLNPLRVAWSNAVWSAEDISLEDLDGLAEWAAAPGGPYTFVGADGRPRELTKLLLGGGDVLVQCSVPEQIEQVFPTYELSIGDFHGYDPSTGVPSCRELLESTDWSKKSTGLRNTWPSVIHAMVELTFGTRSNDAVYYGNTPESLVVIYGEGYGTVVPHPESFGKRLQEIWGAQWEWVQPILVDVLGGAVRHGDVALMPHTREIPVSAEERYLEWTMLPIWDEGKVIGVYLTLSNRTKEVLFERRASSVRLMSEALLHTRTKRELFDVTAQVLEDSPEEVGFLLCYSVEEQTAAHLPQLGEEKTAHVQLTLESSVGVPAGHASVPESLTMTLENRRLSSAMERMLQTTNPELLAEHLAVSPSLQSVKLTERLAVSLAGGAPWPIAQAMQTRQCVLVSDISELIEDYPVRVWTQHPEQALVIPLVRDGSCEVPSGVIIIGLNLRRPLDDEYEDWLQNIRTHLTSGLAGVSLFESQARLDRTKVAWFRGAAHELRLPLTLIAGPLDDALRQNDLPGATRQYLTLAQRNVTRLQRLVTSLLDFSKMEGGFFNAQFVSVDLGAFVSDLAEVFRPAIERGNLVFTFDAGPPQQRPAIVDPVLIETAVSNLLSNALKYTQAGSISVRLWYEDGNANLSVTDTGIGIPRAELALVSNWFHRAQTALGIEGTGIGLGLVKEIVRLHGGQLLIDSKTAAESEDGSQGSIFTIVLALGDLGPYAGDDAAPTTVGHYGRQIAKELMMETMSDYSGDTGPTSYSHEGLEFDPSDTLLVVDDNKDIRDYVRMIFSPFFQVLEAPDGAVALSMARATPPDLILTDCDMPHMTGQELLAAIRADPAIQHVPVVLVSATTDDDTRIGAIMDGAEDYLTKPFKPRELLARVHLHMQMGKKVRLLEKLFAEREHQLQVLNEEKLHTAEARRVEAERRQQEAETRRQEAEESKRQQELLVDLTSHEIRTPVSAILQCSSLVKENLISLKDQLETHIQPSARILQDMDEDIEALESIYQCGQFQERIASDILSLARLQLDMLSIHMVDVDLRTDAVRLLRVFRSEANTTGIRLALEFGDSLENVNVVQTDPVRLGQVLTNLVTNAIRFTSTAEERSITVRYDLASSRPESGCVMPSGQAPTSSDNPLWLYVSVTDTGPGMTPSEQEVIFKRFHQGNRMVHTRYGGTGLGLYVCKEITHLLGGDIEVDSVVGQGTVFRFYIETRSGTALPATAARSRPQNVYTITEGRPRAPPLRPRLDVYRSYSTPLLTPVSSRPSHDGLTVLIVEDNLISQKVLFRQLTKAGHACQVANNGREALDVLASQKFDLVLMDLEMPVMDGLTAVAALREIETGGGKRHLVLALTGNARQGQIDQALEKGMDDVILKPYVLKDLLVKMRETLESHRQKYGE